MPGRAPPPPIRPPPPRPRAKASIDGVRTTIAINIATSISLFGMTFIIIFAFFFQVRSTFADQIQFFAVTLMPTAVTADASPW